MKDQRQICSGLSVEEFGGGKCPRDSWNGREVDLVGRVPGQNQSGNGRHKGPAVIANM